MGLAKAFDRTFLNVRERPLSGDINQMLSNLDYTARETFLRELGFRDWTGTTDAAATTFNGFLSDGFKVDPGSGLQVILRSGMGFQYNASDVPTNIDSANNLNDQHPLKPLVLSTSQAITVPNADPTNPRIDIVEVQYDRQVLNPQSRDILDTTTGVFVPGLVNKDLVWDLAGLTSVNGTQPINYKTGTPAGSPTEPSVDAGYIQVGAVYVAAAAVSLVIPNVSDRRRLLIPGGLIRVSGQAIINLTGNTLDEFHVQAPPGVDVVFGCNVGGNACNNISITIIGPFPEVQAQGVTQAQFGSMRVMCAALTSAGGNVAAHPVIFSESNGGSPPFDNPITFFASTITGFTTQLASPAAWAGGPSNMPKQNQISIGGSLKQFGTDFSGAPSTSIGATSRVAIQFDVTIPVA